MSQSESGNAALLNGAESHELNVGVGMAQYFGDLNRTEANSSFLNPVVEGFNLKNYHASYSIGYRYNFKYRFSVGASFYHLQISGYDSDNSSNLSGDRPYYRLVRNLNFRSAVNQGIIDFRYEPLKVEKKWNKGKWLASPYIGVGIGLFAYNPKTTYMGQDVELQPLGTEGQGATGYPAKYSLTQICVPAGFGVKFYNPSRKFSLALDINYSYTFTDYLDDVSTNYVNPSVFYTNPNNTAAQAALADALANRNLYGRTSAESYITQPGEIRGDPNYNDHFMTGQIKFSYYFNVMRDAYYRCCGF